VNPRLSALGLLAAACWLPLAPPLRADDAAAPAQDPVPAPAPPAVDGAEPAASDDAEPTVWYDELVVSATRSDVAAGSVPLSVSVLDAQTIEAAPDLSMLEVLRAIPSLTLARGAGELVAQPRDQSLNFRGLVGGSQSRALTLVDGLPLTDPYGGFVVWSQVPKEIVERVEVVRGGASSAWGNLALSGVVHLITRAPEERTWSAAAKLGNKGTGDFSLFYSDLGARWAGWLAGNAFTTDGYVDFDPELRGPIDTAKTREYGSMAGRLSWTASARSSLRMDARLYREEREQGLPLDQDRSEEAALSAAFDHSRGRAGDWQLRLFYRDLDTRAFESEPNEERDDAEPSSAIRSLPVRASGLSGLWTGAAGGRHALVSGADFQAVEIERVEDVDWEDDRFTLRYTVRGEQELGGAFVQDTFALSERWTLSAGARYDRVRTGDARSTVVELPSLATVREEVAPGGSQSTVSPSAGAVYAASDAWRWRAALYTGFRNATPTELFVGTGSATSRRTAASPTLEPERLAGAELGLDWTPSRLASVRMTGFWNRVEDLVQRLTVGRAGPEGGVVGPCGEMPPRGTCLQRTNIGEIRSVGVEVDLDWRPSDRWRVGLATVLLDAEITDNPPEPELVGNQVERSADEQVALTVSHDFPRRGTLLVRGRYVSDRFDDPENELLLPSHELVDLSYSVPVGRSWTLFAGVENLLDEEYLARIDSDGSELGAPRLWQAGFRYRFGGR
jgi:outer membrane receptor protein involved in Fe transport